MGYFFLLDLHELMTTSIFTSKSYGNIYTFYPEKLFDHIIFSELRQKIEINFYSILKISGKMQSLLTM